MADVEDSLIESINEDNNDNLPKLSKQFRELFKESSVINVILYDNISVRMKFILCVVNCLLCCAILWSYYKIVMDISWIHWIIYCVLCVVYMVILVIHIFYSSKNMILWKVMLVFYGIWPNNLGFVKLQYLYILVIICASIISMLLDYSNFNVTIVDDQIVNNSIYYCLFDTTTYICYIGLIYGLLTHNKILTNIIWNDTKYNGSHKYMYTGNKCIKKIMNKFYFVTLIPIISLCFYGWLGAIVFDLTNRNTWFEIYGYQSRIFVNIVKYSYDIIPISGTNFNERASSIPCSLMFMLSIYWYLCKYFTVKMNILCNDLINGNITIDIKKHVKILQFKLGIFLTFYFGFSFITVILTFISLFSKELQTNNGYNAILTFSDTILFFILMIITVYFGSMIQYSFQNVKRILSYQQQMYIKDQSNKDLTKYIIIMDQYRISIKILGIEMNGYLLIKVANILFTEIILLVLKKYLPF